MQGGGVEGARLIDAEWVRKGGSGSRPSRVRTLPSPSSFQKLLPPDTRQALSQLSTHPQNSAPNPHAVATHTPALVALGAAPHEHTCPSQAWVPGGGGGVGAAAVGWDGGGGGAAMMVFIESERCLVFFFFVSSLQRPAHSQGRSSRLQPGRTSPSNIESTRTNGATKRSTGWSIFLGCAAGRRRRQSAQTGPPKGKRFDGPAASRSGTLFQTRAHSKERKKERDLPDTEREKTRLVSRERKERRRAAARRRGQLCASHDNAWLPVPRPRSGWKGGDRKRTQDEGGASKK